LQSSDAGSYYVVASNHAGVVTSAVAHLTVKLDPPFFTTQPRSQVSYPGRSVDFTIVAGGTPIPSLQWFRDGSPIPNARRPMFRLLSVTPQDAGAYFCVASNASGMATSAVANLEVLLVPPVLSGPADRSAPAGNVLVLNLTISNPPASVAWFANGAPAQFSGYSGSSPGEPATIGLWVTLGRSNHTAQYFAVASNEFGMSTSRTASITVTTAPPVFLAQPTNVTVLEGSTIFISTWAVGAPPPRFLLHRDGQPVEAFSEYNGLRLLNVTPSHSGEYVLVATNEAGTASSMPFQISVHRAGPLDKWTRVHPMPQGNDLHAIAFGGGRYVACGDAGAVITSTDGTNWSVFFADAPAELQGVTHGNGRYVAVGRFASEAIVVTSSDGERWSTHRVPEAERLRGVAFGQGQFVAVGREQFSSTARAYSSADGTNWSEVVVGSASANFEAVAFANGRWVIAVDGGRAYSSTDLSTWTNVTTGMLKPEGAAFINNQFVITGDDGVIAFSSDGLNWIAHTNHPSTTPRITAGFTLRPARGGTSSRRPRCRLSRGHWRTLPRPTGLKMCCSPTACSSPWAKTARSSLRPTASNGSTRRVA
jgi:hypothetical protein